ncbi:transposase [Streptomyces sp. NPDC127063]|uniref:transposase n=1 Tax=Streptomyces sp. NPDC127063 TaxID=3347123 RepID=UPI00366228AE
MGRGDLTDEQWAVWESLLPTGKAGRPLVRPRWQLLDGIRFRVRTGVPRRACPSTTARGAGSTPVAPVAAERRPSRVPAKPSTWTARWSTPLPTSRGSSAGRWTCSSEAVVSSGNFRITRRLPSLASTRPSPP